jgi:hypothetical protein
MILKRLEMRMPHDGWTQHTGRRTVALIAAWIMAAQALLAALQPLPAGSDPFSIICESSIDRAAAGGTGSAPDAPSQSHQTHPCVPCLSGACTVAVPVASGSIELLQDRDGRDAFHVGTTVPPSRFTHGPFQARGPPQRA